MEGILSALNGIDMFGQPLSIGTLLLRIAAAVFIGAMIGIDREIKNRPAGMRTHVLVCVGAALVSLIEQQTIAAVLLLNQGSMVGVSMGRITTSVVSGVGFLGAGTIFMSEHKISGLTTAASLWCTACIGLAVGSGFIIMALMAGVIVLVILRMMQKIIHVHTLKKLEVQFVHRAQTLAFLSEYFASRKIKVLDVHFRAENRPDGSRYINVYTLCVPRCTSCAEIVGALRENPNILNAVVRDA